jgi:hypothetical protein
MRWKFERSGTEEQNPAGLILTCRSAATQKLFPFLFPAAIEDLPFDILNHPTLSTLL